MERKVITRRDFLRVAGGTAVAAALGSRVLGEAQAEPTANVVLVRHAEVVGSGGRIDGRIVQSMLDEAVRTLLGAGDPLQAWRSLVRSSDVVGIKTNSWNKLPTPDELEAAIKRRVLDVGVAEKNIGIDDRGVLDNPVFLNATALINVRPLRTHHWAGVGTCLKNYITFVPNRPDYHPDGCSTLGKIWTYPVVKGKDPPEHPQRPHPAVLRKGGQLLRPAVRLALRWADRGNRSRRRGHDRRPSPSDKADRLFRRRPGAGRSPHPYRGRRQDLSPRGQRYEPHPADKIGVDGRGADLGLVASEKVSRPRRDPARRVTPTLILPPQGGGEFLKNWMPRSLLRGSSIDGCSPQSSPKEIYVFRRNASSASARPTRCIVAAADGNFHPYKI